LSPTDVHTRDEQRLVQFYDAAVVSFDRWHALWPSFEKFPSFHIFPTTNRNNADAGYIYPSTLSFAIYPQKVCTKSVPNGEFLSAAKSNGPTKASGGEHAPGRHVAVCPSELVSTAGRLSCASTREKSQEVRWPPKAPKSAKPYSERRTPAVMPPSVQTS
jgi:hypothetical protein